jgi:pyridoxal biosynthesis lyase PdxS
LDGSIAEIVAHTGELEAHGAHGLDLLTYRYTGDAAQLLREVVRATKLPIVSAGSIATYDRILEVWQAGAWGFTIGSAFFENCFVPNGTFGDNLRAVVNWLGQQ